tara:strand:+ start:120 stop:350 length:231 start_codon:yes stop_codon:yes gene_type:complete
MCRTTGSAAKKLCWYVIVEIDGEIVKEKSYTSINTASLDLGISKNILYKMVAKKVKYAQKDRKFYPKISIHRLKHD